jgi:hypothetical protein
MDDPPCVKQTEDKTGRDSQWRPIGLSIGQAFTPRRFFSGENPSRLHGIPWDLGREGVDIQIKRFMPNVQS